MAWNSLSDVCLLEVFDRVPLEQLVSNVTLVCRRWHQLLRPSALSRRSDVQLRISDYPCNETDLNSVNSMLLLVKRRENVNKNFLARRLRMIQSSFPFLSSLVIKYSIITEHFTKNERVWLVDSRPFLDLLTNVGGRLVKLDFGASYHFANWGPELCRLINECMLQLRELSLFNMRPGPLPIIKQLSHFKLSYNCRKIADLQNAVLQYLEEGCERLVCCELTGNSIKLTDWLKMNPDAANKITRIGHALDEESVENLGYRKLKKLIAFFPSLTQLYVATECEIGSAVSVSKALDCISGLTQLKTLQLSIDHYYVRDLSSLAQLQMPTVRKISWKCRLSNHRQLHQWFDFAHLFPRLNSVIIEYPNPDDCSLCAKFGVNATQVCIQAMCDLFSGGDYPQLRHVKIVTPDPFDTKPSQVVEWIL